MQIGEQACSELMLKWAVQQPLGHKSITHVRGRTPSCFGLDAVVSPPSPLSCPGPPSFSSRIESALAFMHPCWRLLHDVEVGDPSLVHAVFCQREYVAVKCFRLYW